VSAETPLQLLKEVCEHFAREIEECLKQQQQPPPGCPPGCPPPKIPDRFDERTLASALNVRIAGTPSDGSLPPDQLPSKIVWTDYGDEVLIHLDSLQTKIVQGKLLASVDLETDQTGRTPLVVAFALGATNDPAGLVATTETYPRGNAMLASRWGQAVQAAIWSALLDLAQTHAVERSGAPRGIAALDGALQFLAGPALKVS
jgi:hypothetical protein